jgi:tetratricopeptide (TPR) repeat protein
VVTELLRFPAFGTGESVRGPAHGLRSAIVLFGIGLLSSPAFAQPAATTTSAAAKDAPEEPSGQLKFPKKPSTPEDPPAAPPRPPAPAPAPAPHHPRPLPPVVIAKEAPALAPGTRLGVRPQEVQEHLEARAKHMQKGDLAAAEREIGQLLYIRESLGLPNMPLVSAALIHESRKALVQGDLEKGGAAADAAARISPDLATAHWTRLDAHLARGDLGEAFGAAIDASKSRFRGFRNQVALLTDAVGVALLTLLAFAAAISIVSLLKYVSCAAFDVSRVLPSWAGRGIGWAITLLVIVAPLAMGLGILPTIVLWLTGAMLYQGTRERAISLVVIALVSMTPLLINAASPLVIFHGSVVDAVAAGAGEFYAPNEEKLLEEHAASPAGKKDYEALFVLGARARMRGDIEGAEKWYRDAVKARSTPAARNNLATLLYAERKPGEAISELQIAARNRRHAEPFLNLASIFLDDSDFEEARKAIETAREINPQLTARYNELDAGLPTAAKLLDVPFDEDLLWERLFALDGRARSGLSEQLWTAIGGHTPVDLMPIIGLLCAAIGFVLIQKKTRLSSPCPKCGLAAQPHAPDGFCEQCQTIFLRAVSVDPSMRMEKEHSIRTHQSRLAWTERLLALFAGAGHFLGGRAIEGTILMLPFVAVLAHLFWMERISVHAWATGAGLATAQIAASLVVAISLALISVGRASRN